MNKFRINQLKILLVLLLSSTSGHLLAVDYYVSSQNGSDLFNGLSTTSAFKTIQKAADNTYPGDSVFIMDGTYSEAKVLFSIHARCLLRFTPAHLASILLL